MMANITASLILRTDLGLITDQGLALTPHHLLLPILDLTRQIITVLAAVGDMLILMLRDSNNMPLLRCHNSATKCQRILLLIKRPTSVMAAECGTVTALHVNALVVVPKTISCNHVMDLLLSDDDEASHSHPFVLQNLGLD